MYVTYKGIEHLCSVCHNVGNQAFIRIMVNAKVGSGRLLDMLEVTVIERVMWNYICPNIPLLSKFNYLHYIIAKGKLFEKVYQISLKLGDGCISSEMY